jgi:hypothetical protein
MLDSPKGHVGDMGANCTGADPGFTGRDLG